MKRQILCIHQHNDCLWYLFDRDRCCGAVMVDRIGTEEQWSYTAQRAAGPLLVEQISSGPCPSLERGVEIIQAFML